MGGSEIERTEWMGSGVSGWVAVLVQIFDLVQASGSCEVDLDTGRYLLPAIRL